VHGKISEMRDAEVFVERGDGSRITVVVNIRPLKDQHGNVIGAINCFYDISERKHAEQRQFLLTNELAHRGKDLLAVVQSIASRSLAGNRSLTEARDVLVQRLHALARGQTALASGGYEGAALGEIVRLECETFSERVEAAGPDIILNRRITQTFALLVHELATNATKHGALSGPEGRVKIVWSIESSGAEAKFKFRWQEHDGPPVTPPSRQGFGRILLERAALQDFGAPPNITFSPDGLIYEIDAPLSAVVGDKGGQQKIWSKLRS